MLPAVSNTTSNGSTLRPAARPVLRRRDLELYPAAVQRPSPLPPSPARVTFQPAEKIDDDNSCNRKRFSRVRNSVLADDAWSWDEESQAEKPNGVTRDRVSFDADVFLRDDPDLSRDLIATMLDRLYCDDDHSDNDNSIRERAPDGDEWWLDRHSDHHSNQNEYPDMAAEWKRHAFQFVPESSLLTDGDQVIRVEGKDGSGTLLYDLASCRYCS